MMHQPQAPDPFKTAASQGAANRDTAITQQMLNMTNQITPYGNLTYDQSGQATIMGMDGKPFHIPTFTATTTLSPQQQLIQQQNEKADVGMNNIALSQIDRIGGVLSQPFNYDTGAHEKWAGDLYGKLMGDSNASAMAGMEQKLANQGLQPGTPAYDDAMRNLTYGQGKARNDFMLGSYGEGLNSALTMRNQPFNEIASLLSGSQVQQPTFQSTPNVGVNGVDVAGLMNNAYQAKQNQYNSTMGGLFGLGAAALGGWAGL